MISVPKCSSETFGKVHQHRVHRMQHRRVHEHPRRRQHALPVVHHREEEKEDRDVSQRLHQRHLGRVRLDGERDRPVLDPQDLRQRPDPRRLRRQVGHPIRRHGHDRHGQVHDPHPQHREHRPRLAQRVLDRHLVQRPQHQPPGQQREGRHLHHRPRPPPVAPQRHGHPHQEHEQRPVEDLFRLEAASAVGHSGGVELAGYLVQKIASNLNLRGSANCTGYMYRVQNRHSG